MQVERTIQKIRVTIEGLSPLLMHNAASMLTADRNKRRTEIPTPEEEARASAYLMADGTLYIPSVAVYRAVVYASGAYKIGKRSASSIVASVVRVEPIEISLDTMDYAIDIRTVVIQRQRIVRARARLDKWQASFDLVFDSGFGITAEMLERILTDAGRRVGLLDYRPACKGPFGTFKITQFEEVTE